MEAKKHKDDAESEYMAADNQLLEADTLADDAANEENQLKPRVAELAAALEKAEAELAQVQSFIANFEALREGLPAASAAEVTAGEEVTDQSTATEATAREEATAQSTGGER